MNKNYEPTYEGQLEKCQDERAGLERTVEELSDEIKQLRADVMCLKYQNAEFVRNLTMAQDERNAAVAERDEARRELCKRVESASCLSDGEPTTLASDYASWCGWDCFKENGK